MSWTTIAAGVVGLLAAAFPLWVKWRKWKDEKDRTVEIADGHDGHDAFVERMRERLHKVRGEAAKR